ncbi:LacI family DNA-binding transcriptional regulator [Siculibacillus lacustris]|uniref:LacI family DNA-binding transcriptional regulator n=1 Tax=Siculibacillus lacustris TaxID=1549641 RepID=A0A4Q9VXW9_9HYPH|nr:LacI family DNA-binding transcriptional regulator [Siculibacillus lacustris]TBW40787.1 LacI family DNA-binding transcriptional regulator [Siculibacillus lacustris]
MSDPFEATTATLKDVAREAGVSTATVDRVLHGRPGVRDATIRRVKDTIERLGFRPHAAAAELARGRSHRFCFVMPKNQNVFMAEIVEHISKVRVWLAARRTLVDVVETDVFDADVLAETLEEIGPRYDGLAVVALDHPRVRAAIDELVGLGVLVVTLVSDAPSSRRAYYVGIDNIAAGRTTGTLIGRFLGGRSGKVAVVAGSLSLRDHAERLFGVSQVISADFPNLDLLAPVEGRDDDDHNRALTRRLLDEHPDLVGLYNIGAGTTGIGTALIESGRAKDVVFVGHDLTPQTRRFLLLGVMDAVISQNPGHEARSATRVLLALSRNEPIVAEQEYIGIDIVIRDNLP